MNNYKSVATALNNIAILNLAGSIDNHQCEIVVMDYFIHMVSVNQRYLTQRAKQAVATNHGKKHAAMKHSPM
jgi:ribonuclease HIII